MCKGVAVMRRRSDSWLNATQILKVAGFDKPQRTRVLEREVQKGEHEPGRPRCRPPCRRRRHSIQSRGLAGPVCSSHAAPALESLARRLAREGRAPAHVRGIAA